MSHDPQGPNAPESGDPGLATVDPDLNIFALANGMDLHRDHAEAPDRVLEWFRDGLDRRIHVCPRGDGTLDVDIAAEGKVDGVRRRARSRFRDGIAPTELRGLLPDATEAANFFERSNLDDP